jgi:hypothetical protein
VPKGTKLMAMAVDARSARLNGLQDGSFSMFLDTL